MINKLVFENIRHRWVRTFLCALVVGVQIMLILTLIGLSRGLLEDSASNARGTNADIFLKPGAAGTLSLASGQIDEKFIRFIAAQPHVVQAVGVLNQSIPGELITKLNGVDIQGFMAMSGGFNLLSGNSPTGADDLLVDTYYAQQHKIHAGQIWRLLNHDWHVTGIMRGGQLGRLIAPLKTLQQLTGNASPARLSEILVKLDDPKRTNEEVEHLNKVLESNLTAISWSDFVGQFSINNLPQLKTFISVITFLAVLVGFLVVFLSMYTAVLERTRELGILKALGAKPRTIIDMLVRESVILALAGCILGILLSFAAKSLIMTLMPATLQVVTAPDWWPKAAAIALVGALLGAIYPGLKAARQDAIEALSYE
jgi:putative ABC transport system permease protein